MRTSYVLGPLLALLCAGVAHASALGPLPDPAWGGGAHGIARIAFDLVPFGDDEATSAVALADGRLVLGGSVQTASDSYDAAFVRLDAQSGLPDPTFGAAHDGRVLAGIPGGAVDDVVVAADGGVLFVGQVNLSAGTNALIGRLLADGSPDPSFDGDGHRFIGPNAFADGAQSVTFSRVLLQPDRRIVAIGAVAVPASGSSAGAYLGCVMRFDADGSTDTSFGNGTGFVCHAPASTAARIFLPSDGVRLGDGRLVLAGAAIHSGGSGADMAVLRLRADGAPDTTFGPAHDGWAYVAFDQGQTLGDFAQAIAVDAQGRVVIAGSFENVTSTDIGVARLDANGAADLSFGSQGRVQIALDLGGYNFDTAHSVAMRSDGGILIGGESQVNATVGVAILLKADGTRDARFGDHGVFVQTDPTGPEGGIVESRRQLIAGDYLYMIGDIYGSASAPKAGAARRNDSVNSRGAFDFAATRFVLPVFRNGFEGESP